MNAPLLPSRCERQAGQGLWGGDLLVFDSLPSTNQWVLDHAADCRHGDVVRAVSQTAGRGRFQRAWTAPAGRSLALTVVISPSSVDESTRLFLCQIAALAVREMLVGYGVAALLKWPNDVMASGRKIAGILAEKQGSTGPVALGIGLNVSLSEEDLTAAGLLESATSMAVERKDHADVPEVGAALLAKLAAWVELAEKEGSRSLLTRWARHDLLTGRRIDVQTPAGPVSGQYAGMDQEGRLRLVTPAGDIRSFWSGDVTILK